MESGIAGYGLQTTGFGFETWLESGAWSLEPV